MTALFPLLVLRAGVRLPVLVADLRVTVFFAAADLVVAPLGIKIFF
jgi:hypothetical protein